VGAPGRIVAIVPHTGRLKHYTLSFEGGGELVPHEDVIVALGLRAGAFVTEETLRATQVQEQVHQAGEAALRLLEYRARSRQELIRALRGKGFTDAVVDEALAKLENMGLINDEAFARDHAQSLLRRQYGRQGLMYRLCESGVDDGVAQAAVEEVLSDADEAERAAEVLGKQLRRWAKVPPEKRRERAYQFLARRGFDSDAIATAIHAALADSPDPDGF
jgi:regulatory protein